MTISINFTAKTKNSKKYHIKPRQNRINLLYRTLLQNDELKENLSLENMLYFKKTRVNSEFNKSYIS